MKRSFGLLFLSLVLVGASCSAQEESTSSEDSPTPPPTEVARLEPQVLGSYPHDSDAFTQGLLFHDDLFFESTGLRGRSSLRKVEPETGEVLEQINIPQPYFAEGLALVDDRLIQLTWEAGEAFVYTLDFEQTGTFNYTGEGWGLCYDGESLYMSDGSATIDKRDPETFELEEEVAVRLRGAPVVRLNELECVESSIYANVWQTNDIVRIDKASGQVTAIIDASELLSAEERAELEAGGVLNGIAYDPEAETFFITGKLWPKVFEVNFVPE